MSSEAGEALYSTIGSRSQSPATDLARRAATQAAPAALGQPDLIPAAVSSRRSASPFGAIPDPAEHPLAHHEGDHRNGLDKEPSPPLRVHVSLAHQQPCRPVWLLPHDKGPGAVVGDRKSTRLN